MGDSCSQGQLFRSDIAVQIEWSRHWEPSDWTKSAGPWASAPHLFPTGSHRCSAQVWVPPQWFHRGSGCGSYMRWPAGGERTSVCGHWTIVAEVAWKRWRGQPGGSRPDRQLSHFDPESQSEQPPADTTQSPLCAGLDAQHRADIQNAWTWQWQTDED